MKKEIEKKIKDVLLYIALLIITILIGSWAISFLINKGINKCSWETIEQSRGEGYRRGYIKGWRDNQENNNFDDEYNINL